MQRSNRASGSRCVGAGILRASSAADESVLFFVLIAIDLAPGETLIKNSQGGTMPAIVASPLHDPYDDGDNTDDGE